eukprot:m.81058 g.81058  ORF g.81058 m.81058 type:complete len:103 (-) comp14562_c0_seq22:618-926(-)
MAKAPHKKVSIDSPYLRTNIERDDSSSLLGCQPSADFQSKQPSVDLEPKTTTQEGKPATKHLSGPIAHAARIPTETSIHIDATTYTECSTSFVVYPAGMDRP